MANYSLIVDSKFTPTDYASLLVPIFSDYGTRWNTKYDKAELEYLDRLVLKLLIELEDDDTLLNIYSNYDAKFNDFLESFNRGLDNSVEKLGLEANKLYKETIVPIEREMVKREKKQEAQRAFKEAHPEVKYDVDFRDVKISQMLADPNLDYKTYDGSVIKNSVADMVKSLGNAYTRIVNNPNAAGKGNTVDLYLLSGILKGWNLHEIIQGAANDNNAPEALRLIGENIRLLYDYDNLSKDLQDFMDTKIAEGYYLGLGQFDTLWLSNQNFQSDAYKDKINKEAKEEEKRKYPRLDSYDYVFTGEDFNKVANIKTLTDFNNTYSNLPEEGFIIENNDGTESVIKDIYTFNYEIENLRKKASERKLFTDNLGNTTEVSTKEATQALSELDRLASEYKDYIISSLEFNNLINSLHQLGITNPNEVANIQHDLLYQAGTAKRYPILDSRDDKELKIAQGALRTSNYNVKNTTEVKVLDPNSLNLKFMDSKSVPEDLLTKGVLLGINNNPIYNYSNYKKYFDKKGLSPLESDSYVEAVLEYESAYDKTKKQYIVVLPAKAFGNIFSESLNDLYNSPDNPNLEYNEYFPFVDIHKKQDNNDLTPDLLLYNALYDYLYNKFNELMFEKNMQARTSINPKNAQ